MPNDMLNQIEGILVSGVVTILGGFASYFVGVGVNYLKTKKEDLIKKVGVNEYNSNYALAKDIFYRVEQQYKFIPAAGELKRKEFDNLLLEKIPGLTQAELDHFREAVCGEINNQLKSSRLLAPAFNPSIHEADVKIIESNLTDQAVQ